MDRFIGPLDVPILRSPALLFHGPERVRAAHLRQMREVPRRRRGRGRPLERTTVPRIPRDIAINFPAANNHRNRYDRGTNPYEVPTTARHPVHPTRLPLPHHIT